MVFLAAIEVLMEEILRLENLQKSFGSLSVLKDINLTVNQGEVVTVI